MLSWIQAFLGNRSERMVINGEEPDSIPMNSVSPRAQSRGRFFSLQMTCRPIKISSQVCLFVDDMALYLTIKDEEVTLTWQQYGSQGWMCISTLQSCR